MKYIQRVLLLIIGFLFITSCSDTTALPTISQDMSDSTKVQLTNQYQLQSSVPTEPQSTKEITLTAEESNITLVDGYTTPMWTYNGVSPGPELRLQKGEKLKITLVNKLPQETTIHFHGIRVPNHMDGVPGITQEAVAPGESFVYEFTPPDAGTYWYHPHVRSSEQVERGLYGTIIVEDSTNDVFTSDHTWVIDDWRLQSDATISEQFTSPHDIMHDGRWGNLITVNSTTQPTLEVAPGERLRLRLVNTSNARIYSLSLGKLDAKAFAVDGITTSEYFDPNGFELAPGNRIDLDINIPLDASDTTFEIKDTFGNQNNILGKVSVIGTAKKDSSKRDLTFLNLPQWEDLSDITADLSIILDGGGMQNMMSGGTWTINGDTFDPKKTISLPSNTFQKISIINNSTQLHPMHLHGQFYKVLSRNGQETSLPYLQDTVLIHPNETVELGMVAMDKGKWAFHCHILEHAEAGMMTTFTIL